MSDSWKVTLPCTRAEAEAIAADMDRLADLADPPVLVTREPDADRPDAWLLDAFFETEPGAADLAMLAELVAGAADMTLIAKPVAEQDWVTLSQAGLEPIRAGRFFVHTAAHADAVPAGTTPFIIEAGRAFGTGQHETTAGCLAMLDRMRRQGARVDDLLDLGTGTGLLAFAGLALWPRAQAVASDIDPVSIEVAAENATANGVALGSGRGQLLLIVADGMDHPLLQLAAPFDLAIANILAGPLIDMAGDIAAAVAPGGTLILAGLLDHQAVRVAAAYRRHGLRLADRIDSGQWAILRMRRRPR